MTRTKWIACGLKVVEFPLPEEVRTEVNRQLNRLEKTSPDSMEAAVTRSAFRVGYLVALGERNHRQFRYRASKTNFG